MEISPNPQDYGLPAKFKEFRKEQLDIIRYILRPEAKPITLVAAPTGVGKSLISLALANILQCRTYIVVGTKALQDQMEREFGSMGVRTIKGKDGFPCVIEPGLTASECKFEALTGKARDCPAYKNCPYFVQRDLAQKARTVVFNYAYAITAWNYTQSWSRAGLIVFDECDQAEGWLSNMVKLRFGHRDFADYGLQFPGESLEEVKAVLGELEVVVSDRAIELKKLDVNTASREQLAALKRATNLQRRLKFYREVYEPNWLFKREAKGDRRFHHVEFEPVWAKKFGKMLYQHGERVVFMSATPGSKEEFCFKLGLDPEQVDYIEVPSPFSVESRKIVFWPIGSLSMKYYEANRANMLTAIDTIVGERLGEKGLVHCSSYSLAKDIATMSRYAPYMILPSKEENKTEVLERFRKSGPPRVLVSPVHGRGVDLPDEDCRYIIIPRVPWPDLSDPKVKQRLEERPSWYQAETVDAIIQAAGRAVRHKDDYATTYILDSNFGRLFEQNQEMFPLWAVEAIYRLRGRTDEGQASSTGKDIKG